MEKKLNFLLLKIIGLGLFIFHIVNAEEWPLIGYIDQTIWVFQVFVTAFSTIVFALGALTLVTSGGEAEAILRAKKMIFWGLIGGSIAGIAFFIRKSFFGF